MSVPGSFISAGTDANPTVLCAAPCRLTMLVPTNSVETKRYIKFYDKATAPLVGDTPKLRVEIPPAINTGEAGAIPYPIPIGGLMFSVGLAFRICTGQADSDDTAAAAGDVVFNYAFART